MQNRIVMKKILVYLTISMMSFGALAQSSAYEDYTYPHQAVKERKAIPHRYIREANVKWSKRIHRVIDTREKQNKIMHWPRNPFYLVIWNAAMSGEVKPYADDSLKRTLTEDELREKTSIETTVMIPNPDNPDDPYDLIETTVPVVVEPSSFVKYRIMEDWIFDFNYSDFRATIIAIAPLFKPLTESGIDLGEQELFWVKMDEFRPILANQEVFNTRNDASRLSFDHFFEMRQFNSYIVKESNMYDMDIRYFEEFENDGVAALLEGERIKNDLFILEHDLWEY